MRSTGPAAFLIPTCLMALCMGLSRTPAIAAEPADVAVPRATGLVLDGKPSEAAWASAPTLAAASASPADRSPRAAGPAAAVPVVRVLAADGALVVSVDVAEDPGFSIGVKWMVAPEGAKSVAEAVALSFGPQEIRGPRYVTRGPKGTNRVAYRFRGAADVGSDDRWSIETAMPFEDLGLPTDTTPIRLGVVVTMRTPNRMMSAPAGSAFERLESFARLLPPEGGWMGETKLSVDAEALAKEDAADGRRLAAWSAFLAAQRSGGVTKEKARELLVKPLDDMLAARPDLALLQVLRGNILEQLDDEPGSAKAYAAALKEVPHMREAEWALALREVTGWTRPPATQPSDYDAAFAKIAEAAKGRPAADPATRAAEGILRYRHGDFARAVELLGPLAEAYPLDEDTGSMPVFSKKYQDAWAIELGFRKRDDEKGNLPRARVVTSKGPVLLELFEDETPNSVANFVWLSKAGAYDGTTFHRVIPFFMAQGGDPLSKKGDPRVGQGGPGYAIPTERGPRLPFRGMVAMANSGKDTEGSQFFMTTGTAAHLEGDYSVFGRVIEGQDVVDRLVLGDKIERVEIVRARDHAYRPTTVAGTAAPAPK